MRFRAKSLTSLLFAFLLALPMISVISKVIYVQSNKNAYQSYYGETINEETQNIVTNINNFKTNEIYYFNRDTISNDGTLGSNFKFYCLFWEKDNTRYENVYFHFYKTNNSTNTFFYLKYTNDNTSIYSDVSIPQGYTFKFQLTSYIGTQESLDLLNNSFYTLTYNKYSYLDNVFEYAVDEVIKENNFGNIDFFSYFTSIFVSDNQVNNRYIGYVNYYLNYALMVSLAYLLFLMLMWFINFARRFLDRGMNYDW